MKKTTINLVENTDMAKESLEKPADAPNTRNPPSNDVWLQRLKIGGFAATILATVLATATLQAIGKESPPLITLLGMGALHGLSRSQSETAAGRIRGSS